MLRRLFAGALVALVFVSAAYAGPSCTIRYPHGYHVPHGTKKRPLKLCTGGDLQTTWGAICVPRYNA
jgi:hypothetical protein